MNLKEKEEAVESMINSGAYSGSKLSKLRDTLGKIRRMILGSQLKSNNDPRWG